MCKVTIQLDQKRYRLGKVDNRIATAQLLTVCKFQQDKLSLFQLYFHQGNRNLVGILHHHLLLDLLDTVSQSTFHTHSQVRRANMYFDQDIDQANNLKVTQSLLGDQDFLVCRHHLVHINEDPQFPLDNNIQLDIVFKPSSCFVSRNNSQEDREQDSLALLDTYCRLDKDKRIDFLCLLRSNSLQDRSDSFKVINDCLKLKSSCFKMTVSLELIHYQDRNLRCIKQVLCYNLRGSNSQEDMRNWGLDYLHQRFLLYCNSSLLCKANSLQGCHHIDHYSRYLLDKEWDLMYPLGSSYQQPI